MQQDIGKQSMNMYHAYRLVFQSTEKDVPDLDLSFNVTICAHLK